MALHRLPPLVVAVALCGLLGCKDKSKPAGTDLEAHCEQLAKSCGDNDKHIATILDDCKQAAKPQADKGCTAKAIAAYDCYEKELCGQSEKVWALSDLHVLTDRKHKCTAERDALTACVGK